MSDEPKKRLKLLVIWRIFRNFAKLRHFSDSLPKMFVHLWTIALT